MSTPAKKKGTAGETELVKAALKAGLFAQRMPPGANYDLFVEPPTGKVFGTSEPVTALATRPDRGQWLVSIPLPDFLRMLDTVAKVEVKRYARFSLHAIFEKKFPIRKSAKADSE